MCTVAIIHNMPFPEGYAATIRFISYSQGLMENGCNIHVLCIKPSELSNNVKNAVVKGIYNGIPFEYTAGTTIRNRIILIRPFINLWGFLNSIVKIIRLKKNTGLKAILMIGPLGLTKEFFYFLITKLFSIKILQERSEYPFLTTKKSIKFRINLWLYLHFSCRLFDGMLVISKPLESFYSKFLSKKARIFIIPIIVDTNRFDKEQNFNPDSDYIAYCGSMEGNKDGLPILIGAFSQLSPKYPELYLKLIGRTDFNDFDLLKKNIEALGLDKKIIFTGRVKNEEMTILLKGAKLLALARPNTIQAQGNFPTKIGEYLATAKPIVTTKVGVIPEFLTDGKTAYLAEPDNLADFASKLDEALSNYDKALTIGKEGQKLAYTVFNYRFQGERLATFIKSI